MHGSETWPMKVEHELKMNRTKMSTIRWMCGAKLNERKKSEELRELLGLEPVSLMTKKKLRECEPKLVSRGAARIVRKMLTEQCQ